MLLTLQKELRLWTGRKQDVDGRKATYKGTSDISAENLKWMQARRFPIARKKTKDESTLV
jgi:hypothetical protein